MTSLHDFQDEVLAKVTALGTSFYLTGGAAAARGYLGHRTADGLDLAVDDDPHFAHWADQVVAALSAASGWTTEVSLREPRFVRLRLERAEWRLPVALSNEAFPHVGEVVVHPVLGRLSSEANLLADLVIALADQPEPDHLADLWAFCAREGRLLAPALEAARSKGASLFPIDLARVLSAATRADWELVRWIAPPPPAAYLEDLRRLAEGLLLLKA